MLLAVFSEFFSTSFRLETNCDFAQHPILCLNLFFFFLFFFWIRTCTIHHHKSTLYCKNTSSSDPQSMTIASLQLPTPSTLGSDILVVNRHSPSPYQRFLQVYPSCVITYGAWCRRTTTAPLHAPYSLLYRICTLAPYLTHPTRFK